MFIMAKKKQAPKTNQAFKKVTILFGYGLFVLVVIDLIITIVIPWATLLVQPYVLSKLNISIQLVSFVFAVILPPLIGYILGQKVTHRHDRLTHHFNGVLFGIVAYWVSIFMSLVAADTMLPIRRAFDEPLATIVAAWPILATLIIMSIIAFYYAHNHKQKDSVLQDRVYQTALLVGVLSIPVYEFFFLINAYDSLSLVLTLIQVAVTLGLVVLSRYVIHRFQPTQKNPLSLSVIAVSIGLITMQLSGAIIALANPWYVFILVTSGVLGIVAWLLYLLTIIRKA